jgi:HK97 family phage major capsid protein
MGRLSLSNTLIDDSGFSIEGYLGQEIGNWMDLHYEQFLTNGTGIGQPKGVWATAGLPLGPGAPGSVQTAASGVLDPDVVKSMRFNILPQYEQKNFSFIMNQSSAKVISLMKSTGGVYLFQRGQNYPGIVEPVPDSVDGFPIVYNQFAPDIAAGSYPILFGSLQGMFMPQRMGLTMRVLNEIEAVNNRRVYLFRLRWGSDLIQEQYLKFLQIKP